MAAENLSDFALPFSTWKYSIHCVITVTID